MSVWDDDRYDEERERAERVNASRIRRLSEEELRGMVAKFNAADPHQMREVLDALDEGRLT